MRRRKAWYRPKLRWFVLYLPLLIMALIAGLGVWGWKTVKDLGRVDVGDSLAAVEGDAVNYLIVGSDTREGADQEAPDAAVIGDTGTVGGKRSDTIIVLRVEPERSLMMSIPRDLWATNVATGKQGRINGTFNQGPDNLIRSVTANLGIPINHYVEVDFVSFAAMVDAMGGITLEFPYPAYDPKSGLRVISDGPVVLDGANALAYVRSRTYTEIREDGSEVVEPTGDLGRQQRQQDFIRTVLRSAGQERNPLTLARVASGAAKGVRVDQEIGFGDLLGLARRLGGGEPESRVLPTRNARKGEASVLELVNAEALPILLEFGAG